jgi:D-alanyl-D-alanine carboxypeptidase
VFTRTPAPVAAQPPPPRTKPPAATAAVAAAKSTPVASAGAAAAIDVAKVRRILLGPDLQRKSSPPAAVEPEAPKPVFARADDTPPRLPQFAQGLPPSTLQAQAAALERSTPVPADPAPQDMAPQQEAARTPSGPFAIQIGAYSDASDAEQHMDAARRRTAGLLDPYHAVAVPFRKGSSQLYRARFRGFDANEAASACLQLRRLNIDCFVVSTQ